MELCITYVPVIAHLHDSAGVGTFLFRIRHRGRLLGWVENHVRLQVRTKGAMVRRKFTTIAEDLISVAVNQHTDCGCGDGEKRSLINTRGKGASRNGWVMWLWKQFDITSK